MLRQHTRQHSLKTARWLSCVTAHYLNYPTFMLNVNTPL